MISAPENLQVGFVLSCAAVVFLMQAGFCLLESGLVRTKNSINVAVKNVLDCALTMLIFTVSGFAMMFGVTQFGIIGGLHSVQFWQDDRILTFFLYQLVFCSTAATIVSGAVAERVRLGVYLVITLLVAAVVYPIFGHWAWGGALPGTGRGWLSALGFVDWAGCVVVHVVGGFSALAAAQAIGRRRHVQYRNVTGGHSLTLAILGCFLLWFGWWGFNGGSGLAINSQLPLVLVNTNLGAAIGTLVAAGVSLARNRKIDVTMLITGMLAGLVGVTGACHAISPVSAAIAGGIAAALALVTEYGLKRVGIDDVVSAFPVHGAAGLWGGVVFAIFAPESALVAESRLMQLGIQLLAGVTAAAFSYVMVFGVLKLLSRFVRLRVRAGEERLGLNMIEHGATTEVIDLLGSMHQHRATGDYSRALQVDLHTEIGQIGMEYNRVLGRVQEEIEQHQETNEWLQGERLRLQSVLEYAGVGIYQMEPCGRVIAANTTLLETLGFKSTSELLRSNHDCLLPWHDSQTEASRVIGMNFERGLATRDLETHLKNADGEDLWALESLVPIRDAGGNLMNWLGTLHDITERRQAMIAEVEIAEAKSQAKGEFLANMSHEIRTPLNGVIGMLDLLHSAELKDNAAHFVSIARSSADSLLSLINDILDFSKIEAGRFELESIAFDLREMVESIAEQFAFRAHHKNLELNCELAKDLPYSVVGDPERLRQVIVNLLGNAIKFTEQGEINLRVSARGSTVRFSVQDTGIGMTPEVQTRLFQSFMQADASTTRQYGGTGLGLAISSQLVQLMGGQIKVGSVAGEGSEFWFEVYMPVAKADKPSESRTRELIERLPKTRVLVVDDNATNCEILTEQLSHWGLEVGVCQDATTAVERMLIAQRLGSGFDLVVLDFCMPKMSGQDVALAMRREASLPDIPIIMLSSNHELLSGEELAASGIQVAMTKPARQSRLLDSIMNLVSQSLESPQTETPALENQPTKPKANALSAEDCSEPTDEERISLASSPAVVATASAEPKVETQTHRPLSADVLIAEDNQVNQLVVQQMLKTLGYSTDLAEDGLKAFEKVQRGEYRLVLMDGHMPIMDGITATREIRQWESNTHHSPTPIVALTANVVQGVRQECLDAGMDDYLCKPITLQRLRDVTDAFLGKPSDDQNHLEPDSTAGLSSGPIERMIATLEAVSDVVSPTIESAVRPASLESRSDQTDARTTVAVPQKAAPQEPKKLSAEVASANRTTNPVDISMSNAPASRDGLPDQEDLSRNDLICADQFEEQFSGDQEFAAQILTIMRDSLPGRMKDLRAATNSGDWADVRAVAHQLKGAAGDCSMTAIFETAAQLEKQALNRDREGVDQSMTDLQNRVDRTLGLIGEMID